MKQIINNLNFDQVSQLTNRGLKRLLSYATTDELMKQIESAEFIYPNLIVKGALTVISAESNGGKTTIMMHAAKEATRQGFEVIYINVDANASQCKEFHYKASKDGFLIINPDLHLGGSIEKVIEDFEQMVRSDIDLTNYLIIIDTLKKFTSVMQKGDVSSFMKLCRKMTLKGCTIVLLSHTNKYPDKDNHPIFEGVNDVKSDCDNLIYLIPEKQNDGALIVSTSTNNGKTRFNIEKITFIIDKDLNVTLSEEYIDLFKYNQHTYENDKDCIDIIKGVIGEQELLRGQIREQSMKLGVSFRAINRILDNYPNDFELTRKEKNTKYYKVKTMG